MEVVAVVRIRVATRGREIDTSAQLTEVEKDANIQLVQNRLWEAQAFAQVTAEAGDAQWKDATNLPNHQLSSVLSMVGGKSANTMVARRLHVAVLITALLMEEVFDANSRGATVWPSASSNYVVLTEGALTDLDQEGISLLRQTLSHLLVLLLLLCRTFLVFITFNICMFIFTGESSRGAGSKWHTSQLQSMPVRLFVNRIIHNLLITEGLRRSKCPQSTCCCD
jgi:hypothetical protein